jgi:hypothetical protein
MNMAIVTIDDVLARLEAILADALANGKRTGYFAALYYKMTAAVKAGITEGMFEDGPRMERLDVVFASRYLDAHDAWEKGLPLTDSWRVAFEACGRRSPLILQQLLLGINAHINLDLGIAAVEVMKGQPLDGIHIDFNSINEVIGSLTNQVIREIDHMSPLLSLLGLHANNTNSFLIQFSVGNARDGAWCFAEELSRLSGDGYSSLVVSRDGDIAKLATALITVKGPLRFTLWVIRLFEWGNVGRIIGELRGRTKKFFTAKEL